MWHLEKLPNISPDFYWCIDNPELLFKKCYAYIIQLGRFPRYQKIGIASSIKEGRDSEYGKGYYRKLFANRLEDLVFEGAMLSATERYSGSPDGLHGKDREEWQGVTELRKISWRELEKIVESVEHHLDEYGIEDLAKTYFPMSDQAKQRLEKALQYLEVNSGKDDS